MDATDKMDANLPGTSQVINRLFDTADALLYYVIYPVGVLNIFLEQIFLDKNKRIIKFRPKMSKRKPITISNLFYSMLDP